jgi:hypothetical protein
MYMRKIAAAATFATGAALAFAPLAAADPSDFAVTTLDSEISSQNSLFELEALLAGQYNDITLATAPGTFDTIPASEIPTTAAGGAPTTLEYELYGVNPIAAGISGDTGPYSEFNGALTQFDNALNVQLYSLLDGGHLDTNLDDYIYNGTIQTALATPGETVTQAYDTLYNQAIGDLGGYFQTDLSSFEIATAPAASTAASGFDITSTLTSEINGLNSLFASDVAGAGLPVADITQGTGDLPFDTFTGTTNDTFNTLVFGLNPDSVTDGIPGSYDVLNGALGEFANAYNVGLFSLLDPTGTFDPTDIIGLHAAFLDAGATSAIGEFLSLGVSDLLGYFDPSALLGAL